MEGTAEDEVSRIDAELLELREREERRKLEQERDSARKAELLLLLSKFQTELSPKARQQPAPPARPSNEAGALIGVDIGGSLAKLVFYEPTHSPSFLQHLTNFINATEHYGTTGQRLSSLSFKLGDGTFHFIQFETRRMASAIDMVVNHNLNSAMTVVSATGGGAFKFANEFQERAQIQFRSYGELECMVRGLLFLVKHTPDELFMIKNAHFSQSHATKEPVVINGDDMFPFIVVNIGSGVSILHVEGPSTFQRVSGTALGGGTYLGLSKLLLKNCSSFEQALKLAETGHSSKIDLLVGDIYGGRCEEIGLSQNTTAACFAKMVNADINRADITDADFARALLTMITNNIGQIALLTARQHKAKHVIFAGSFLRHNDISQRTLAFATEFWSQKTLSALFLKHEGFCGAIGALLHTLPFDSVPAKLNRDRSSSVL